MYDYAHPLHKEGSSHAKSTRKYREEAETFFRCPKGFLDKKGIERHSFYYWATFISEHPKDLHKLCFKFARLMRANPEVRQRFCKTHLSSDFLAYD